MASSSAADNQLGKRARTGEPDVERTVVRSADLWLDDGNIVLRTQASQQNGATTLYKVHKSTLALHCTFFKDLFGGPQTAFDMASERYDGVPVMDMHDDAKDVNDFLKALYFPRFTHRQPWLDGLPSSFPGVYAGVLRLAKKYDAPDISFFIIKTITGAWPTALSEWHHRQSEIERQQFKCPEDVEDEIGYALVECYPDPAQTIRIAIDHSIHDVLPVTFYDLVCVYETQGPSFEGHRHSDLALLTSDELRRFITGRGLLNAHVQKLVYRCSASDWQSHCERRETPLAEHCADIVRRWWAKRVDLMRRNLLRRFLDTVLHVPFTKGLESGTDVEPAPGACESCQTWLASQVVEAQKQVWRKLPDFFELRGLVGEGWGIG